MLKPKSKMKWGTKLVLIPLLALLGTLLGGTIGSTATAAGGFGTDYQLVTDTRMFFEGTDTLCQSRMKIYRKVGTNQYGVRYYKTSSNYSWSDHTTFFDHQLSGPYDAIKPGIMVTWNAGADREVRFTGILAEKLDGPDRRWRRCEITRVLRR